jgi:polyphosphate kinase
LLAIYATNLDEFFMVGVAGLRDEPGVTIDAIAERVNELAPSSARVFGSAVRPALAEAGIHIASCDALLESELAELDSTFREEIFPVLTPLAVGPGRPFPYISNLSLNLAVCVRDPVTGGEVFARVKVPNQLLPRFIRMGESTFVPLEDVIAHHLGAVFPGVEILRHSLFRVTRDAEFTVTDQADDLLTTVKHELRGRRLGQVVRVEIGADMDMNTREWLIGRLDVEERQVYEVDGLLDMSDLWQMYRLEWHAGSGEAASSRGRPPGCQLAEAL